MKSAPPSISPSTCSTIISSIVASYCGWLGSGPIEPATKIGRSAASATSRASRAPARTISRQPLGQGELGQRHPVGAEGVGRQHVGAGVAVVGVDLANELRVREAQLVERAVGEDVVPVDFGAHGPVEDQHAVVQGLWKGKSGHRTKG